MKASKLSYSVALAMTVFACSEEEVNPNVLPIDDSPKEEITIEFAGQVVMIDSQDRGFVMTAQSVKDGFADLIYRNQDAIETVEKFYSVKVLTANSVKLTSLETHEKDPIAGEATVSKTGTAWSVANLSMEPQSVEYLESRTGMPWGTLVQANVDGSYEFIHVPAYVEIGESYFVKRSGWHPLSSCQYHDEGACDEGWYRQEWVESEKEPEMTGAGWTIDEDFIYVLERKSANEYYLFSVNTRSDDYLSDYDYFPNYTITFSGDAAAFVSDSLNEESWTMSDKITPEEFVESIQ